MSSCNIRKYVVLFFAAFSLFIAAVNVFQAIRTIPGYDLKLRYHEVECIRKGIDPYDIVMKNVPSTEYALFGTPEAKPGVKTLHVYTPWEYTWFLPFSFLSERAAGAVFFLLSACALIAVGAYACVEGRKAGTDWVDSVFAGSAAFFTGYSTGDVLTVGNYGAINALLIVLLIITLTKKHDILAGFVWALLMMKPQIGVLFAIPILMKRRFITAGVAVATCILCAIPPALMCGKNPLELILEVPRACSGEAELNGTMIIPSTVFRILQGKVPYALLGGISMSIGGALCFILTWRFRRMTNWLIFLAPTVVCALIWNYCKPHDRVILSLTQLVAALVIMRTDRKPVRIFSLFLIFLTAWPLLCDDSTLTKIIRRIPLVMLVFGCWILPKLHLFAAEKENAE